MTYRFVQGIDYGARKGTLGFAVHMAEGGDGTVAYLARRPGESDSAWRDRVRGVSANFVILSTGQIVQMVGWGRASGSMNPRDRAGTTGFYRTQVIQEVLGSHYTDPNAWSISVEVTGFRRVGPNPKQVAALIELVKDARARYPSLRGAYGHADQTDTKGCPGLAAGMLSFWNQVGHGLFLPDDPQAEEPVGLAFQHLKNAVGWAEIRGDGHAIIPLSDGRHIPVPAGQLRRAVAYGQLRKPLDDKPGDRRTGFLVADTDESEDWEVAFVLSTDVDATGVVLLEAD